MFFQFLSNMPWLHVLVAAVAYFALGAIWYGPLFSKAWLRGHGVNVNAPDAKKGVAAIMFVSFIVVFIICIGLAYVQHFGDVHTLVQAIKMGAFLGFGFAFTTTSMTYLYLKKPLSLHLIDGMYHVVGMIIGMIIIALWK